MERGSLVREVKLAPRSACSFEAPIENSVQLACSVSADTSVTTFHVRAHPVTTLHCPHQDDVFVTAEI